MRIQINATHQTHQHYSNAYGPRTVRVHSVAIYGTGRHADGRTYLVEVYGVGEDRQEALDMALRYWREARPFRSAMRRGDVAKVLGA